MSVIIVMLILVTIGQVLVCHFSLWWIISIVARIMFCCRVIGATFKFKKIRNIEIAAFVCMFVFNLIFSKNGMPWVRLLLYILFSGAAVLLEWLDDRLYVYVVENEEDYDEED